MPGIRDLKEKVVVITGAGAGIGRLTALAFAREGADLVLSDICDDRINAVAREIESLGARVLTYVVDVGDREQMVSFAAYVIRERGHVDVLVNNAGVSVGGTVADSSIENWEWVFRINVWGVIYGIKAFLPHMIDRRYGQIVNMSSLLGLVGIPGTPAYNTTKFAVSGLSESMRVEVRKYNIGVSNICPSWMKTRIVEDGRMEFKDAFKVNRTSVVKAYDKYAWPPEWVAKAVVRAVRKDKAVVPVGPDAWVLWFLKRSSQNLYDLVMSTVSRILLGNH
ncbi:putative short chain dehydrogenase/reductase [Desulfoluna limicola]|uniref:Short chain dehydrogenase/reductase n=1 Tax=Desulfoluna limicola TaxID=2810562 RepID=A0ABM7PEN4_9BACT|nr:SDR family NAD(P)-dependent oxidoreductase [Desulfoluna limicola]BCS95755.1 putative short chain dehydrogenase/reductase [Desulfoluna limicola]